MSHFEEKSIKIHAKIYMKSRSYMDEMSKKQFILPMQKMIQKSEKNIIFIYFCYFSPYVYGRKIKLR